MREAKVNEIFESIQGEGIFVGVRQLFVRFFGCNLKCWYCDTKQESFFKISAESLQKKIDNSNVHSICFTGGEPMLYADFIKSLKKTKPFYLETNMSLPDEAKKLKFMDYVAGDLKIRESGNPDYDELLEKTIKCFKVLRNTRKRVTFCKIILPEKFNLEEVENSAKAIENYVTCYVLQPVFGSKIDRIVELQKRMMKFKDTRLIPQIHKYLGVR